MPLTTKLNVTLIIMREGRIVQGGRPDDYEVLTVKRIHQKIAKITRGLPRRFSFHFESDDRKVIFIGRLQCDEEEETVDG